MTSSANSGSRHKSWISRLAVPHDLPIAFMYFAAKSRSIAILSKCTRQY